jgi:hypothetical protein
MTVLAAMPTSRLTPCFRSERSTGFRDRRSSSAPVLAGHVGAQALVKRLRVAALGLWHESNTFSEREATIAGFTIERGDEIRAAHGGGSSTMSGFLDASRIDVEVTPLLFAHVTPMGRVLHSAFELIWDEMQTTLKRNDELVVEAMTP